MNEDKRRLKDIFDNIGGAIWSTEIDNNRLIVSAGFEQVYVYPREAFHLNSRLWQEVIHPEDTPFLSKHMETLASGKSSDFEHLIITMAGEIRWVHCI